MKNFDKKIKDQWIHKPRIRKVFISGILSGIALLILFFVLNTLISNSLNKETDTFTKELCGKIISRNNYKGDTWIKLYKDSASFVLINSYNYSLKQPQLYKFLRIGDSIYKPSTSDSLFIYRENKQYLFILGNLTLNKP